MLFAQANHLKKLNYVLPQYTGQFPIWLLFLLRFYSYAVVVVWWLDLQLPMQSVPITTKVVSSNPIHMSRCTRYNFM
jgi:hypothetical protein